MLEKTITYNDYNGVERTETFYFNLNKSELTKLDYSKAGGLTEWINRAVQAQDGKTIIDVFETIIAVAYGVKSPDGKTLKKSQDLLDEFKSTNAYDQLFMEIVTDAEKAAKFILDCLPPDVRSEAVKQEKIKKNLSGIKEVTSAEGNNASTEDTI